MNRQPWCGVIPQKTCFCGPTTGLSDKNMSSSVGMVPFPSQLNGNNKSHVPNHQPVGLRGNKEARNHKESGHGSAAKESSMWVFVNRPWVKKGQWIVQSTTVIQVQEGPGNP